MSSRKPQQVLIAGAGVAGLEAVLALQALTDGEVSVELVAPEAEFTYRPLAVTEPFGVGEVKRFPLQKLAEAAAGQAAANRIAQPTGTSYTDSSLGAGTYYYRVQAEDAAGNLGAASNEATAVVTGDTQAPSAPGGLVATAGSAQAALTWTGSTDNVAVTRYDVYRSTTSGFTPGLANRIAQPTVTNYIDAGLIPGTYYYRVAAEDAAGNISAASNETSATVVGDTTPPTVSVTAPTGGSTVSATVAVTANANDNGSVASVQFKLDGNNLGAADTPRPTASTGTRRPRPTRSTP